MAVSIDSTARIGACCHCNPSDTYSKTDGTVPPVVSETNICARLPLRRTRMLASVCDGNEWRSSGIGAESSNCCTTRMAGIGITKWRAGLPVSIRRIGLESEYAAACWMNMKELHGDARWFIRNAVGMVIAELGFWVPVCRQRATGGRGDPRSQNCGRPFRLDERERRWESNRDAIRLKNRVLSWHDGRVRAHCRHRGSRTRSCAGIPTNVRLAAVLNQVPSERAQSQWL